IELNKAPAGFRSSHSEGRIGRQVAGAPRLSPQCHDGADRYVEGAIGSARQAIGHYEYVVEVFADPRPSALSSRCESHQLAVRSIITHDGIESCDAIESRGCGPVRGRGVGGGQDDSSVYAHVDLLIFEPLDLLL